MRSQNLLRTRWRYEQGGPGQAAGHPQGDRPVPGVPRADDFGGPVPLRHGGGRRSALRNIGVIGEAVNHLPDDLARRHPEVDWAAIVGMRNVVVHEYFGVDIAMLLDVLDTDLPQLADVLSAELEGGSAG